MLTSEILWVKIPPYRVGFSQFCLVIKIVIFSLAKPKYT